MHSLTAKLFAEDVGVRVVGEHEDLIKVMFPRPWLESERPRDAQNALSV
jgi:hypothetical protein